MRRPTRKGLRHAVGRSLGRLRGGPSVTVIVMVPEGAGFLDACLASVRASVGVEPDVLQVPEAGFLGRAVAAATGDHLAFLSADDTLDPTGLADLVAGLAGGAPVATGQREVRRGSRTMPVPPPGSPVDLSLTGKLFRTSFVRATQPPFVSWARQAVTVAALVRAAPSVAVLSARVCVERERDTSAPVDRQRRFRPDLAAERISALTEVLASLPADRVEDWCTAVVADLLPQLCRDAVGGGPAFAASLQPFARDVVTALPHGANSPVESRLTSWVAAHGNLHDVALAVDHLVDNPHGLPTTGALADQPAGLSVVVPDEWRAIGPADRVLRSRVLDPVDSGAGRVLLRGNAFVTYASPGALPEVTLDGEPVLVRPWPDRSADEWAERGWEDRSGCGFEVELDPGSGDHWQVRVSLGGFAALHEVARRAAGDQVVDEVELEAGRLTLRGAGAPARARLAGANGTSPWADVDHHGAGRFEMVLPLWTHVLGDQTLLPGGRYELDVQGPKGRPGSLAWAPALAVDPPDLVHGRIGLRLEGPATIVVGPPLSSYDRSAFVQRQRISAYAAVPRAEAPTTVLLESFHGRVVADNPAAIGRELAGRSDVGDLDLVWVVDDPGVRVPEGTRAAPRRTQGWFDALAEAHAYVGNAAAPPWFHKSDGQFHLQTWHGTPLKKIGEDRGPGDFNTWRHRRHLAGQAARWDAMISPSPYCTEIFRSAFRYDGPMLEIGYPRNDVLLSDRAPQVRAETRQRLGLTDADRVLLYAPTWREYIGIRDSKPLFLDPARVVAAMPDTVVLVRGHYNASRQPDVFPDRSRIIDVTRYPDIADLYLAADSLVTDYSSVMFDFALTDKPMVLLTPDLDQYRDVERGFYFDIEADPPGPMVGSTDDVVHELSIADRYAVQRARFREEFCPHDDGYAAARACEHLLEHW